MSTGEVLYFIHDTNTPEMREVASYRADAVAMADGSACILFQLDGELVGIHHLAPGHSLTPEPADDVEDMPMIVGNIYRLHRPGQTGQHHRLVRLMDKSGELWHIEFTDTKTDALCREDELRPA